MNIIETYLQEGLDIEKPFIIHIHDARNTNQHFDVRIGHPYDDKILLSFAFGKEFKTDFNKKVAGVRTKDHNVRWLELKSYRLNLFDKGYVKYITFSQTFIELEFMGKKIIGKYKMFKVKSDKRNDRWLLVKNKES